MRCNVCNGRGIKVTLRQLGPGMVQQMQTVCPECRGEGEIRTVKLLRVTSAFLWIFDVAFLKVEILSVHAIISFHGSLSWSLMQTQMLRVNKAFATLNFYLVGKE